MIGVSVSLHHNIIGRASRHITGTAFFLIPLRQYVRHPTAATIIQIDRRSATFSRIRTQTRSRPGKFRPCRRYLVPILIGGQCGFPVDCQCGRTDRADVFSARHLAICRVRRFRVRCIGQTSVCHNDNAGQAHCDRFGLPKPFINIHVHSCLSLSWLLPNGNPRGKSSVSYWRGSGASSTTHRHYTMFVAACVPNP